MKLGSGQRTPNPTIDERAAAMVKAFLKVEEYKSVTTSLTSLGSVF
jgi:hypothetical protein